MAMPKNSTTATPPALHEELELKIEGVGSFGEGLARHQGTEIFVPKTVTHDVVKARIREYKKGRARAELLELITPSPLREAPRCSHFETCGGCDFQHIQYEEQLAWKLRITKHWIRRSPLAPLLNEIPMKTLSCSTPYEYRGRVRLQIKDHRLHYFKPHSNELIEIKECPILEKGFFQQLAQEASSREPTKNWNRSSRQTYEIGGHSLRFSDQCFTQANLEINRGIWREIEDYVSTLASRKSALDLFCGIGNFSIPLRDYFDHVTGVELEGESLSFARQNSQNVEWISASAEEGVRQFLKERRFFDLVLLDPPRPGAREACQEILHLRPPHLIYVSCHLETLISDLVLLMKSKQFRIHRWVVADMFPQTRHIESIVFLSPRS